MATAADADLVLKLYDLRREPRMRKAREWVFTEFNPGTLADLIKVQRDLGSDQNQFWRQVLAYWEMAAYLVLHGALDGELFVDSTAEKSLSAGQVLAVSRGVCGGGRLSATP